MIIYRKDLPDNLSILREMQMKRVLMSKIKEKEHVNVESMRNVPKAIEAEICINEYLI